MSMFEPGEQVTLIGDVFPGSVLEYGPDPANPDGPPVILMVPEQGRPQNMVPKVPDGLPKNTGAILFRVLITNRGLVVGYQYGGEIHRVELPVPEEQTLEATHRGGVVGPYEVILRGDCKCKARMLSTWSLSQAFPGLSVVTEPRMDKVAAAAAQDRNYGLVPTRGLVRYSRI